MKKTLLLSVFIFTGLVNAKNIDLEKGKKEREKSENKSDQVEKTDAKILKMQCIQNAMFVWCTGEFYHDTVCWGEGSGTATYQQAIADEIHNSQLLTEYICGQGTGSGWGTGGPN